MKSKKQLNRVKKSTKKVTNSLKAKRVKIQKIKPAALKVVELGQPIIRAKAKKVKNPLEPRIQKLIADMVATCEKEKGVGIAAPQVSVSEQLFVIWERPTKRRPNMPTFGPEAVINPRILSKSSAKELGYEGCLSIPGILGNVPRHKKVTVAYTNGKGKQVKATFKNFRARVFQHEFDHLKGIVFLDRIKGKDIITEKEYMKMITHKK